MSEPSGAPDLFGDVDHPEWGPDVFWPIWIPILNLPGDDYRPVILPDGERFAGPEVHP